MATVTNIKAALTSGANIFNAGKTVDTAEIARMKAWFESDYHDALMTAAAYVDETDPENPVQVPAVYREATADDFSALMWRQVAAKVKQYEEKVRAASNTQPEVGGFSA